MRRLLILAVALVAGLGMLAPPAMAQAPAPKVTITGFIDTLGTYAYNTSTYDSDYTHKDTQAYGRNRGRFDIIGEVGKAKAVLGLELDFYFGQTGSNRFGNLVGNGASAGFGADGSLVNRMVGYNPRISRDMLNRAVEKAIASGPEKGLSQ